jgi:hypothetical protein
MADDIGALAMGTMQDLDDHGFPSRAWVILFDREDSTFTALKYLQFRKGRAPRLCRLLTVATNGRDQSFIKYFFKMLYSAFGISSWIESNN